MATAAIISRQLSNPTSPENHSSSFKSKQSKTLISSSSSSLNLRIVSSRRKKPFTALALQQSEHDVVVIGAGIIGLSIARQLLLNSDLSVAVVDANVPCYGATGAGQGYIWMTHKTPGSETWELAMRGKKLWEEMAEGIAAHGLDPLDVLGWKKTGSLLIGRTMEQLAVLQERIGVLSQAGIRAEYLSATDLISEEPALYIGNEGGAAFLPDDCQLDASRAVAFIEKDNKTFALQGRYIEIYKDPAIHLLRSGGYGEVDGVLTAQNILYSKRAVIVAAGAWSGSLMQTLLTEENMVPDVPVKPRKGHLLVLENNKKIHLNHGLMEVGYIDHQVTTTGALEDESDVSSISMTATLDSEGNLVIGSSRQFIGFNREISKAIVKAIWERAGEFLPSLRAMSPDITKSKEIRIGHRPYMPDGKPIIGPVPSLPKLLLATGHEGSGLSLALSTAELVADTILGNPLKVDCSPFRYPRPQVTLYEKSGMIA